MMSGSNFGSDVSQGSGGAGCHCQHFSQSLIGALWLTISGSSFTTHSSLCSGRDGCPVLWLLMSGSSFATRLSRSSDRGPLPLLARLARWCCWSGSLVGLFFP
ncbi:unnamed protein product [Prorocentrum cordatum]|uniref:Uncharacterized protein n=1 Tax=Prorocentrum cordatum TaxID=2364126 RepID=A0ABN9PP36_9DINO|nr:unnamed protein product [Polarella glacialis]